MVWIIFRGLSGAISLSTGAALAAMPRDWIERWFALDPDAVSGSFETALPWLLVAIGLSTIASVVYSVRRRMKTFRFPGHSVETSSGVSASHD